DRCSTVRFYMERDLIDWTQLNNFMMPQGSSLYTNFKESNLKTFRTKLMFDTLPVLENLKQRKPDIYSNTLTCIVCSEPHQMEDLNHLWTCRYYRPITIRTLKQCIDLIKKKIHKRRPDANLDDLDGLDCWSLTLRHSDVNAFHFIRGFIPVSLYTVMNKHLNDTTRTTKIISKVMFVLHNELRTRIWLDRCEKVNEWEKSQDITTIMKRAPNAISSLTPYKPFR